MESEEVNEQDREQSTNKMVNGPNLYSALQPYFSCPKALYIASCNFIYITLYKQKNEVVMVKMGFLGRRQTSLVDSKEGNEQDEQQIINQLMGAVTTDRLKRGIGICFLILRSFYVVKKHKEMHEEESKLRCEYFGDLHDPSMNLDDF